MDEKNIKLFKEVTDVLNKSLWGLTRELTIKSSMPDWELLNTIREKMLSLRTITIETNEQFKYDYFFYLFSKESNLRIENIVIEFDFDNALELKSNFLSILNTRMPGNLKKYILSITIINYYVKTDKNFINPEQFNDFIELKILNLHAIRIEENELNFLILNQIKDFIKDKLEVLTLKNIKRDDSSYFFLSQFTKLNKLTIGFPEDKDFILEPKRIKIYELKTLTNLKEFIITGEIFPHSGLKTSLQEEFVFLKNTTKLEKLQIHNCENLTDGHLKYITNLIKLKELTIFNSNSVAVEFTGDFIKYIKKLSNLKILNISHQSHFTIQELKNNNYIEKLTLFWDYLIIQSRLITNSILHTISNIQKLDLRYTNFSNIEFLAINRKLPKLKYLAFGYPAVKIINGDQIIDKIIKYMPNIEHIEIINLDLSSKKIKDFIKLEKIKQLRMYNIFIEEEDFEYLKTNKKSLEIWYNSEIWEKKKRFSFRNPGCVVCGKYNTNLLL